MSERRVTTRPDLMRTGTRYRTEHLMAVEIGRARRWHVRRYRLSDLVEVDVSGTVLRRHDLDDLAADLTDAAGMDVAGLMPSGGEQDGGRS